MNWTGGAGGSSSGREEETLLIIVDKFFALIDTDILRRDLHQSCKIPICLQGWISGAELRFMLANMGDKMSYDEVDLLLDEAGIDGGGKFRCRQL